MEDKKDLRRQRVMEQAAKYLLEEVKRGEILEAPEATERFLRTALHGRDNECFCVLFLDTRHRVIVFEEMFKGTLDGCTVYPRVVAKRALELNAAAVIFAHNHPSGIAEPSLADQVITRRLKDALGLFDIRLLDHFVIGDSTATSLAKRGLL